MVIVYENPLGEEVSLLVDESDDLWELEQEYDGLEIEDGNEPVGTGT